MGELDMRTEFAMNLVDYLKLQGRNQADLAKGVGVSISTVSDWCHGRKLPRPETTKRIADFLGVDVYDLNGPRGRSANRYAASPSFARFRVIGSIAAGYGALAREEYTGEEELIPLQELSGPAENYFVLRVSGNSMYPKLLDGDRVLVRRTTSVDSGRIAVVLYDSDTATVKRVNYKYGENWLELEPTNPEYPVKRIEGVDLEQCRVLGEVVKLMRNM